MIDENGRMYPRFFAPEQLSPELLARRNEYISSMLQGIEHALNYCSTIKHDMFILFFGLNQDYGSWSYETIAETYEVDIDEVKELIRDASAALTDEQLKFAREYYALHRD